MRDMPSSSQCQVELEVELKNFIERSDLGRTFLLLSSQLLGNIG